MVFLWFTRGYSKALWILLEHFHRNTGEWIEISLAVHGKFTWNPNLFNMEPHEMLNTKKN